MGVVALLDFFHAFHEVRKVLELRPLVVDGADRSVDVDGCRRRARQVFFRRVASHSRLPECGGMNPCHRRMMSSTPSGPSRRWASARSKREMLRTQKCLNFLSNLSREQAANAIPSMLSKAVRLGAGNISVEESDS